MIEAHALTKTYGPTLAVDGLSFRVEPHTIVGFLGPNGAGKTTTLRMITGYTPPTRGTASVAGHDILKASDAARKAIGYLPESTPLYDELRVHEYLQYCGKLRGMDKAARKRRIGVVVERCGLQKVHKRVIGHLSKGNRQRVGLAQAMLHDPPVLILDEPSGGLDPAQIAEFRRLLADLREQHTILLSSHILGEIARSADRVLIIRDGKLAADGSVEHLAAGARGGSRVIAELQADAKDARDAVAALPDVKHAEAETHARWTRITAVPSGDADPRPAIAKLAEQRGWPIRELGRRQATLEDLYLELFEAR